MAVPPGAPILPPSAGVVFDTGVALLTGDDVPLFAGSYGPQWGLFLDGENVVDAESTVSFEYLQEWRISDYPVEQGGFESYNKVAVPFEPRLRFATGGSIADRQALLSSIAAIAGDTNLYDAVMPEQIYQNVNVTRYSFNRAALNGVGLLIVDVWCEEIRTGATTGFQNTQSPSGADPVNDGTVQTTTPTGAQAASSSSVN